MRSPWRASVRRAGARATRELHQATGSAGCKPSPGAPAPPSSGRGLRRRGGRATGRPRAWRAPRRPLSSGPFPRAGARPRKHRKSVWKDDAADPGSLPIGERHAPSTRNSAGSASWTRSWSATRTSASSSDRRVVASSECRKRYTSVPVSATISGRVEKPRSVAGDRCGAPPGMEGDHQVCGSAVPGGLDRDAVAERPEEPRPADRRDAVPAARTRARRGY